MNDRKILTLNEVLNLNRRPTLQEMVDLSIEDYTKYLYKKGIIKYMPEKLKDYVEPDCYDFIDYDPDDDIVLELKNPNGSELIDGLKTFISYWDGYADEDYNLNESLKKIVNEEYGTIYGADGKKYDYSFYPDDFGVYNYLIS